jgi:hypothetical protein
MQKLEVFQSLWAMSQLRPDGFEWSLADQFEMMANESFDGVDIVYGDFTTTEVETLLKDYGLASTITAFPESVDALKPAIEMALTLNARHLNIIGKVYPFEVNKGAEYLNGWIELCADANLPVTIETHRDSITTDMHYCLQLMQAVPEMKLCADLSHFVVGREFGWPITELIETQIENILDRSVAFQGRVASREQIQLQVSFAHHQEWFDLFAGWWAYGFKSWQNRAAETATLNFLCELGPKEYAMTGSDGYELSDRWQEALMIKQRVQSIWSQLN